MFAVMKAAGRQFKVQQGDKLEITRQEGKPGDTIEFKEVLALGGANPIFGSPLVAGASVQAKIVEHTRADKVVVFKFKRRKNYRRTAGHRQPMTKIEITKIAARS